TRREVYQAGLVCASFAAGYCASNLISCKEGTHDVDRVATAVRAWLDAPLGGGDEEGMNGSDDPQQSNLRQEESLHRDDQTKSKAVPVGGQIAFILVVDLHGTEDLVEFPCLALDVTSGRQVGRFHRWIKPSRLYKPVPEGINASSTAIPFSEVLSSLHQWMAELGVSTGETDKVHGVTRESNFRWVIYRDEDLMQRLPRQICLLEGLPLPTHFHQWTNALSVCSREEERRARESRVPLENEQSNTKITSKRIKKIKGHKRIQALLGMVGLEVDPNTPNAGMGTAIVSCMARCVRYLLKQGGLERLPVTGYVSSRWQKMHVPSGH
ncbi:unnamed protein product, partial [Choristocarpus tenellus]